MTIGVVRRIDWYGNARPLFLRGRVFALLGYEIVEGTLNDGRMQELRRINYAPGRQYALRRLASRARGAKRKQVRIGLLLHIYRTYYFHSSLPPTLCFSARAI